MVALMAIASIICGVTVDWGAARSRAGVNTLIADKSFWEDVATISNSKTGNFEFARALASDPKIIDALSQRGEAANKAAGQQVAYAQKMSSFPGDIDIVDASLKLVYSTAAPKLTETPVRDGLVSRVPPMRSTLLRAK